jgi:hypothetical protein
MKPAFSSHKDFFAAIRNTRIAGLSLFTLTFLVYLSTLAPGVYGFDSAELATGVFTQGIVHPPGFPLYLLLGKLFIYLPIRDVAYRLNLMSAVFASITALFLYKIILQIVKNRFAAWISAFLFAISNYFWQMALVAEVYTIFTALVAIDIFIIILWRKTGSKKYLLAFSFVYGLTLTIHTSGGLFAPAFTWLILTTPSWKKNCWKWVGFMFILFVLGLSLYAYLPLRASAHPQIDYSQTYSGIDITTPAGFWWMVSGKAYTIFSFKYTWNEIPHEIMRFVSYLWRNYLGVGVIFGLIGIFGLFRKNARVAVGILLIFLANVFFYVNYRVMDKDTMFLPAYLIWAIFIAFGLETTSQLIKRFVSSGMFATRFKDALMAAQILIIIMALSLNWRWVDMSQATGYSSFAREMMAEASPNSVIIAPWSSAVVLEYYQVVEGIRPDLTIINRSRIEVAKYYELWGQGMQHREILDQISLEETNFINQEIQQKNIYAVEYDPVLATRFEYLPEGPVFRLAMH